MRIKELWNKVMEKGHERKLRNMYLRKTEIALSCDIYEVVSLFVSLMYDQSIASTKTKYIKLNTKPPIFFYNIQLLYTI